MFACQTHLVATILPIHLLSCLLCVLDRSLTHSLFLSLSFYFSSSNTTMNAVHCYCWYYTALLPPQHRFFLLSPISFSLSYALRITGSSGRSRVLFTQRSSRSDSNCSRSRVVHHVRPNISRGTRGRSFVRFLHGSFSRAQLSDRSLRVLAKLLVPFRSLPSSCPFSDLLFLSAPSLSLSHLSLPHATNFPSCTGLRASSDGDCASNRNKERRSRR